MESHIYIESGWRISLCILLVLAMSHVSLQSSHCYGDEVISRSFSPAIPGWPENIKCTFHKQKFICNFQTTPNVEYNCSLTVHTGVLENCCTEEIVKNHKICNGSLLYDCEKRHFCRKYHQLKITWESDGELHSLCHIMNSKNNMKPSEVGDLQTKTLNSTAIKVIWSKPDDKNSDLAYKYKVWCGDKQIQVLKKVKNKTVETVCSSLDAYQSYNITVRARLGKKGYYSVPVTVTGRTSQDVPLTGPSIPDGLYSVINEEEVIFYPLEVPKHQQRGIITNTSFEVHGCLEVIVPGHCHWVYFNLSSCNHQPTLKIATRAATKVDWSEPFIRNFDRRDLAIQYVKTVRREGDVITWDVDGNVHPDEFTVHFCYARQDMVQHQLVKCFNEIQSVIISGTTRSYQIKDRKPITAACDNCAWRYAISTQVSNFVTGMVWESPKDTTSTPSSGTAMTRIIPVIIIILLFLVLIVITLLYNLYRKNAFCAVIKVEIPYFKDNQEFDTDFMSPEKLPVSKEEVPKEKRDSGMESLEGDQKPEMILKTQSIAHSDPGPRDDVLTPSSRRKEHFPSEKSDSSFSHGWSTGTWDCSGGSGVSEYRQIPIMLEIQSGSGCDIDVAFDSDCFAAPCLLQDYQSSQCIHLPFDADRMTAGNRSQSLPLLSLVRGTGQCRFMPTRLKPANINVLQPVKTTTSSSTTPLATRRNLSTQELESAPLLELGPTDTDPITEVSRLLSVQSNSDGGSSTSRSASSYAEVGFQE